MGTVWPYLCWVTFLFFSWENFAKAARGTGEQLHDFYECFSLFFSPCLICVFLNPSNFPCALFESGNLSISPDFTKGSTWLLHVVDFANYYNTTESVMLPFSSVCRHIVCNINPIALKTSPLWQAQVSNMNISYKRFLSMEGLCHSVFNL